MTYCEKCGTRIPEGTEFCPRCGRKVLPAGGQQAGSGTAAYLSAETKLGIRVNLAAAMIYFCMFSGGYTAALLLTGYFLLFEKNDLLSRTAVRSLTMLIVFSILFAAADILPDAVSFIRNMCCAMDGYIEITAVEYLGSAARDVLSIAKAAVFLFFGLSALQQNTVTARS